MNLKLIAGQIASTIEQYCKDRKWKTKVYVGKTDDPNRRGIEHEQDTRNEKSFYLTVVAEGTPEEVAKMETALIEAFEERGVLPLMNKSEKSTGNPCADKLYVTFSEYLPDDTLGEWEVKLPLPLVKLHNILS